MICPKETIFIRLTFNKILEGRMNTQLYKNIDWVGFIDWTMRDFHGFMTKRGSSYNSYLIRDEKTALIDTVKEPYKEYLLKNIEKLTELKKVDYIIVNHAELDHSSSLSFIVKALPNAKVVCNQKCQEILSSYYDVSGWNFQIIKTGETLSLGQYTLRFIDTPMVHWPESMFTYVEEAKLLFSMDAFGQHFATEERFDDEVDKCALMEEVKTYYANIVLPYGNQVKRTLENVKDLEIKMIATSHGVIWRKYINEVIADYKNWMVNKVKPKVVVIYDSMWQSTKAMAEAIVEGASIEGVEAKLIYIRATPTEITEAATEILDAACIAFGSATLNSNMMPMMGAVTTYLKGLRPLGRAGLAFGSCGWGKGGAEILNEKLEEMNFEIIMPPLKSKWRPDAKVLQECKEAGQKLAEKALKLAQK